MYHAQDMPHNFTSFICNYVNFTAESSLGPVLFKCIIFVLSFSALILYKPVNILLKDILSTKLVENIISVNFNTVKSFLSNATGNKTKHIDQAHKGPEIIL